MMENRSSYHCDPDGCPHADLAPEPSMLEMRLSRSGHGHCWHESAARRLKWQGGPSANAPADLKAWNALGQRRKDRAA